MAMAIAMGHGPWPRPMGMGHGPWPMAVAPAPMAMGHGHGPWRMAMGHGHCPGANILTHQDVLPQRPCQHPGLSEESAVLSREAPVVTWEKGVDVFASSTNILHDLVGDVQGQAALSMCISYQSNFRVGSVECQKRVL